MINIGVKSSFALLPPPTISKGNLLPFPTSSVLSNQKSPETMDENFGP